MKLWIVCGVLLWASVVGAQDFLPATDDVPLMDGLYQVEENATFDSPSEKMTIISAMTREKPVTVMRFYRQVLINLGWQAKGKNHFIRGSDTLVLELTSMGQETAIQFTLVQKN